HPAAERPNRHQDAAHARIARHLVDELSDPEQRRGPRLPPLPKARLAHDVRDRAVDHDVHERAGPNRARAPPREQRPEEETNEVREQPKQHRPEAYFTDWRPPAT